MARSPLFPGSWEADSRSENRVLASVFSAALTRVLYLDRLYLQYTCFRLVILEAGMETGQSSSPCEPHVGKGLRLSAVEGSHSRFAVFPSEEENSERVDVEGAYKDHPLPQCVFFQVHGKRPDFCMPILQTSGRARAASYRHQLSEKSIFNSFSWASSLQVWVCSSQGYPSPGLSGCCEGPCPDSRVEGTGGPGG